MCLCSAAIVLGKNRRCFLVQSWPLWLFTCQGCSVYWQSCVAGWVIGEGEGLGVSSCYEVVVWRCVKRHSSGFLVWVCQFDCACLARQQQNPYYLSAENVGKGT